MQFINIIFSKKKKTDILDNIHTDAYLSVKGQ